MIDLALVFQVESRVEKSDLLWIESRAREDSYLSLVIACRDKFCIRLLMVA
jgi:hypothetical protein